MNTRPVPALVEQAEQPLETSLETHNRRDLLIIGDVLGTIYDTLHSEKSKRVYASDIKQFTRWLVRANIDLQRFEARHFHQYQTYLKAERHCSNITVNRMVTVARRVITELRDAHLIETSSLEKKVRHLNTRNETTHTVLTEEQAQKLLQAIDTRSLRGKRDYAIVQLLLRTGLRRTELHALNTGDMGMEQGHHVLSITGKGDKPATQKIPVDVWRYIQEYQDAFEQAHPRMYREKDAPLFVSMTKGDKVVIETVEDKRTGAAFRKERRIDSKTIENTVKALGKEIGITDENTLHGLTPHGLRATFGTLALERGVPLHKVQYAMRHADPRTTERYQARKEHLDDHAVDALSFLSRK